MKFQSRFIWTDLSTYNLQEARDFYQFAFNWKFTPIENGSSCLAFTQEQEVAEIYLLPEKFQKKQFPSFWMPYIAVSNVEETIEKAKKHRGAIVEVEATAFKEGGKIALIRDPLGAGFTVIEGADTEHYFNSTQSVVPSFNELHVSDLERAKVFYEDVFNWEIVIKKTAQQADITLKNGEVVGTIYQFSDADRSGYEYWMQVFNANDLEAASKRILEAGGRKITELEEGRTMFQDSQNATFILAKPKTNKKKQSSHL